MLLYREYAEAHATLASPSGWQAQTTDENYVNTQKCFCMKLEREHYIEKQISSKHNHLIIIVTRLHYYYNRWHTNAYYAQWYYNDERFWLPFELGIYNQARGRSMTTVPFYYYQYAICYLMPRNNIKILGIILRVKFGWLGWIKNLFEILAVTFYTHLLLWPPNGTLINLTYPYT